MLAAATRDARRIAVVASALIVALAGAAGGIIVEFGSVADSAEAPVDDPGWGHVAVRGDWTAVYLGGGWVLTARHVKAGEVILAGRTHALVVGTPTVVTNPNQTATDLLLFRVDPEPDLRPLRISEVSPIVGSPVVMIGRGFARGDAIRWQGHAGFHWGVQSQIHWGTNTVAELSDDLSVRNTRTFATRFSIASTRHEGQAALGDSGGAVFARDSQGWALAGIMLAVDFYEFQPSRTALYGNRTFIADLARYRAEIEQIVVRDQRRR